MLHNLDGLQIMYGYLAIIMVVIFSMWGIVSCIEWLREQKRAIKQANNMVWRQNGDYKL